MEKIGLFPGSFDPITLGHLDLIKRSAAIVDHLYVGVFQNTHKVGLFSNQEKVDLVKKCVSDLENVTVIAQESELTIQTATKLQATVLFRGIRSVKDYEYERDIALMNHDLAPTIETIILFSKPEYAHISSSLIKEIWHFNGEINSFVPRDVKLALEHKGADA
ncbi:MULTISPECIES: pantetheine-phosphate adenylyltransferase [Enterococcus]|uniref:Phosphopantetheine adenylyltransferase n=1 Tax=Enterococcus sulfureus ATCC 49903 TaxID=1140003 RepID=S0P1F9_9ENTE|nr:pantetheine-phosphate adenylyltransferase [Enterococcus sulfureus]EOT47579.1 pantetheine-phosphate adenylyltransferase [Enterococcus sulfureus ATCC 49903]EOT84000.1 pantetheine-phosphate adenylyltransferase [Enterococcus sulfureus ATCC 49903]